MVEDHYAGLGAVQHSPELVLIASGTDTDQSGISVKNVTESRRHRIGAANEEDADHDDAASPISASARSMSPKRSLPSDSGVGRW